MKKIKEHEIGPWGKRCPEKTMQRPFATLMGRIAKDAGSGHVGKAGDVVKCPRCRTGCDHCGGTGYRTICHFTVCHEYGCSMGTCSAQPHGTAMVAKEGENE